MSVNVILKSSKVIDSNFSPEDLQNLLLKNRQISKNKINAFINPPYPKNFLKLDKAVKLIKEAISQNKNILIYGDYDVDGITATAILWLSIFKHYKNIHPYIPHRERDGYGFNFKSFSLLEKNKDINFDLIITLDNGIVAHSELKKLKKLHRKIIVVDHHLALDKNPPADAIIHSTTTSAATLSWFLSLEFDQYADLGLAALGTVADCLPLTDINRQIVVHGLKSLNTNPSFGIKKLISISEIKNKITTYELSFVLGPRINATGRLSDPTDALRLLCSQNTFQASKFAQILNDHNKNRQDLQKEMLAIAEKKLNIGNNKFIFLSDAKFHPGLIGLIAGRLTEKYHLPAIIISKIDGYSKGSCRSVSDFNIIETLRAFSTLFIDLGGHSGAAGFTIDTKNISKLEKKLIKTINKKLINHSSEAKIEVDAQMSLSAVNKKNILAINSLQPFGIGNPKPFFLFKDQKIINKKLLGSNQDHLKIILENNINAIAFQKGKLNETLKIGDTIDIVASVDLNIWGSYETPQLIIKEIV